MFIWSSFQLFKSCYEIIKCESTKCFKHLGYYVLTNKKMIRLKLRVDRGTRSYVPEPYTLGLWESDVLLVWEVFDEEKCVVWLNINGFLADYRGFDDEFGGFNRMLQKSTSSYVVTPLKWPIYYSFELSIFKEYLFNLWRNNKNNIYNI